MVRKVATWRVKHFSIIYIAFFIGILAYKPVISHEEETIFNHHISKQAIVCLFISILIFLDVSREDNNIFYRIITWSYCTVIL